MTVTQTAAAFGVPSRENKTLLSALRTQRRQLKWLACLERPRPPGDIRQPKYSLRLIICFLCGWIASFGAPNSVL
jgi:hypothetical protein